MTSDDKTRFTLRLPSSVMDLLKIEADGRGVTVNALIAGIVWDHIKATSTKRKGAQRHDKAT